MLLIQIINSISKKQLLTKNILYKLNKLLSLRYKIHPCKNIILGLRDELKSLRTQYQVQNNTQIREHQIVVANNGKLEVKNYPKNNQTNKQQNFKPPNCPSCERNKWLEFDECYYCKNCEYFINKQKQQTDKIVRRQDHYFSSRLTYANEKIREI